MPTLQLAQEPAADALLDANPFALLVGMLLDQQVQIRLQLRSSLRFVPASGCELPVQHHGHENHSQVGQKEPELSSFLHSVRDSDTKR